jgi:opacity protein-like surface antigen
MVAAQFRYPLNERFAPYLVVGGGFSMNSFTLDSSVTDSWSAVGLTVEESVKGGVAFQVGAGLDVNLTPKVNLGLDVRYVLAKADGEWSMADQASDESVSGTLSGLSLSHMVIGLSLKYAF